MKPRTGVWGPLHWRCANRRFDGIIAPPIRRWYYGSRSFGGKRLRVRMNTLVEYFGGAYLINLPERKDRLNRVKKELARVGWEIGGNGVQIFPAFKFSEREGFPNAGARGCFFSHLECMRRAH